VPDVTLGELRLLACPANERLAKLTSGTRRVCCSVTSLIVAPLSRRLARLGPCRVIR